MFLFTATIVHALEMEPATADEEEHLGAAYLAGKAVPKDPQKGIELLKRRGVGHDDNEAVKMAAQGRRSEFRTGHEPAGDVADAKRPGTGQLRHSRDDS